MEFRTMCAAMVLVVGLCASADAQVKLDGTWSGKDGPGKDAYPVVMKLTAKGKVLTGTRMVTLPSYQQNCEIRDGRIDGRLFSFKCDLVGPDGGNPFTAEFEGFINVKGTEITVSPQKPASGGPVTLSRQ